MGNTKHTRSETLRERLAAMLDQQTGHQIVTSQILYQIDCERTQTTLFVRDERVNIVVAGNGSGMFKCRSLDGLRFGWVSDESLMGDPATFPQSPAAVDWSA